MISTVPSQEEVGAGIMPRCRTDLAFFEGRISASRGELLSYQRKPSKGVAMIREVYPLVASFWPTQPLSVPMMNGVDYGKYYKKMVA